MANQSKRMVQMRVCTKCGGQYPCWCGKPHYVNVWEWLFVYIMRCRG